ncbi:MAG: ThiF family adenylyltransferase, partial [Myxococcales bacterium]|nr:ThiF family adenylyltransferase [Myxococcales bacterium]
ALRRRVAGLDIRTHLARLDPQSPALAAQLLALAGDRDRPTVILECSDSPGLKFAVHDACRGLGLPLVIGGVVGWRGQAMAIDPSMNPRACYRCLFEAPPPRELAPACAAVGVVGAVAGVLGQQMAALALALLEGGPEDSPAGTLVDFDLLAGRVRRLSPAPRPGCGCNQIPRST